MKAILPFKINYSPIKRLALINFEKKPEKIYKGLELQYIDGKPYGTGYRVIAYRNNNFVDVYDDFSLTYMKHEKFNVAENGLNKHIQTQLYNVRFEKTNGNVEIAFSFSDLENRKISVSIIEHTKEKSIPMNLLAPIGVGSRKPNFMPLFFLYDFDFVRRAKTTVNITIDGKDIPMDNFPLPMNMQFRYYSRYSINCQLAEFINTDYTKLLEVELDNNFSFKEDNVRYCFNKDEELKTIYIETGSSPINVEFEPALLLSKDRVKVCAGKFSIIPAAAMGIIRGDYKISEDASTLTYKLTLTPSEGWKPVPNSRITKMILGPKSVFSRWSRKYKFEEVLSFKDMTVLGKWSNENLKA